jgi:recombination protein RecT
VTVAELKKSTGLAPKTRALTFPDMLEGYKNQIASALPRHLNADRMARIALTEFRKNPDLAKCDPKTIFASIIIAAQLGLEPGVMGQAYLVPYKGVCTLVPGWQGYVDLVGRSGRASVWTDAVHPGDRFEYHKGTNPSISHEPGDDDETPFSYVYAVGRIRNAEWPIIEVRSRNKVTNHLRRYNRQGEKHYALQNENNFEMYGRKVALMQVLKYMPKSVEVQTAVNLDQAAEQGTQTISVEEAIAGTFVPNGYQDEAPQVIEAKPAPEPELETLDPQLVEIFGLLGWGNEVCAKWLKANAKLSPDERLAKLKAELEK